MNCLSNFLIPNSRLFLCLTYASHLPLRSSFFHPQYPLKISLGESKNDHRRKFKHALG